MRQHLPTLEIQTEVSSMKLFICQFCNRETTNPGANKAHENRCKTNPNKSNSNKPGRKIGHKGENQFTKAKRLGLEKPPGTMSGKPGTFKGKKHTDQTKQKISKHRKAFLENNPHMSPWVYSHYTKRRSYAERYWKKILEKNGLDFEEQFQISRYCLDFAIVEKKIDIEIDGEQHHQDQRIIESDKRRNTYLQNLGWKIIRIRWSDYKKLITKENKVKYIQNVINEINLWSSGQ